MKRHAPAAERNRGPILEVLRAACPAAGRALEVASGTGQHVVAFAQGMPDWHFTPSDPDPSARASIDAWVAQTAVANVDAALGLDAAAGPWPNGPFELVFNANMIHISPWTACLGLLHGAAGVLSPGGTLVLYGPFVIGGQTAPSNRAFDQDLRRRDPAWGVRALEDVVAAAEAVGLRHDDSIAMPANNHCIRLGRAPA